MNCNHNSIKQICCHYAKFIALVLVCCFITALSYSQDSAALNKTLAYQKVIKDRATKIVNNLSITDSNKYNKVVNIISEQYTNLNKIHDSFKANITTLKSTTIDNAQYDEAKLATEAEKNKALRKLHSKFLKSLNKKLDITQIDLVKNGMTYNVLNVTFTAYKAMLLNLTEVQSAKIYNWLLEARELAMDEGSSDDKHKMFGKYKGRINNYLSTEGYDMKKEEDGWRTRIKLEKENKKA
jgi:Protein of unknown function (DUF3826)